MDDTTDIPDALIERAKAGKMTLEEYQTLGITFMQYSLTINKITHSYLRDVRAMEIAKIVLLLILVGYVVASSTGII